MVSKVIKEYINRQCMRESSEKMAQKKAALACVVCGSRNYTITLGQNRRVERLELKKFCKYCNKKTVHRETK